MHISYIPIHIYFYIYTEAYTYTIPRPAERAGEGEWVGSRDGENREWKDRCGKQYRERKGPGKERYRRIGV